MLRNILFILSICLSTSFVIAQDSKDYPVFKMNDEYSKGVTSSYSQSPTYQLTNTNGFKFDCTRYDFTSIKEANNGNYPDKIIITCHAGLFMVDLSPTGVTIVDKSTMVPFGESGIAFNGFKKGEKPVIQVGQIRKNNGTKSTVILWYSAINVL